MKTVKNKDLSKVEKQLLDEAIKAYGNAYAPYSGFKVGAALVDCDGNIHSGCNVESADYTLTTHAEMAAIDAMVCSGGREIGIILVVLSTKEPPGMPCGLCRQKIIEFSEKNTKIISVNLNGKGIPETFYFTDINELLPFSFSKKQIKG